VYGIPIDEFARLGLGNADLLRGIALLAHGDTAQAGGALGSAVETLSATLPAFDGPGLGRYQAQNRQFLGDAYQWSGYLHELGQDYPSALKDYQSSLEQFDACLALAAGSSDRVIQTDIAAGNCQPMRQYIQERLKLLQGDS